MRITVSPETWPQQGHAINQNEEREGGRRRERERQRERTYPPQKFTANMLRFMERRLLVDKLYQDDLQYFSQEGRAQCCYMPTKVEDG